MRKIYSLHVSGVLSSAAVPVFLLCLHRRRRNRLKGYSCFGYEQGTLCTYSDSLFPRVKE